MVRSSSTTDDRPGYEKWTFFSWTWPCRGAAPDFALGAGSSAESVPRSPMSLSVAIRVLEMSGPKPKKLAALCAPKMTAARPR